MKILSFDIEGLLNKFNVKSDVDPGLAIITGRNGAGKTSLLKLLWSVVSGNVYTGLLEVPFHRARLTTDLYTCTIQRLSGNTCKVEFSSRDVSDVFEDIKDDDGDTIADAEDQANDALRPFGSSVFFPTFRRIEGGFGISVSKVGAGIGRPARARADLEEALVALARTLSHQSHTFVASISTSDIVSLLLRQYADLSQEANAYQTRTSQNIIQVIKGLRKEGSSTQQLQNAIDVLTDIGSQIEEMERKRKAIMAPIEEVGAQVQSIFSHTGIRFSSQMSFGDAATAIDSNQLSAGEKQMLSFLCYNAFYKNAIIFIDEPELSLHADWQRDLCGVLSRQQSSNQFIIATHSPFIYSKYPDKEIELDFDRGDVGGQ